jgi:hypothetical protein
LQVTLIIDQTIDTIDKSQVLLRYTYVNII